MVSVDNTATSVRNIASLVRIECDTIGVAESLQLLSNKRGIRVVVSRLLGLDHGHEIASISAIDMEMEVKTFFAEMFPQS
jgi:IS30 family transposase